MQRAASRYNPTLTFEQYQVLLERKRLAHADGERLKYKDLMRDWGVKQYALATAVQRGIKQYDYKIWKQERKENSLPSNAGALPLLQTTTTPFVQNNEQEQPR